MQTEQWCWVNEAGLHARGRRRKAQVIESQDKAYVVQYEDGMRDRVARKRVTLIEQRKPVTPLEPVSRTVTTVVRSAATLSPTPLPKPALAKRSERYKEFVRRRACLNCTAIGRKQQYPTEADHEGPRAVGRKTSDLLTVPLCTECHRWVTDTYCLPYRFPASKRTLRPREETEAMILECQRSLLQGVLSSLPVEAAVEVLEVGLRLLTEEQLTLE